MKKVKFTYKFDVEYYAHNASNSKEEHGGDFHNDDYPVDVDVHMNILGPLFQDEMINCIQKRLKSMVKVSKIEKDEKLSKEEKEKAIELEKQYQKITENREEMYRLIEKSIELIDVSEKECVLCGKNEGTKLREREYCGKSLYCESCWDEKNK
jgi:hypothetical protein